MESIGKFIVGLALFVLAVIVRGYTVSVLWRWFIVPPFNAPTLSVIQAVGLSLVVGAFTMSLRDLDDKRTHWERIYLVIFCNLYLLLVGYVYTLFL